jgi:hypothetical protein
MLEKERALWQAHYANRLRGSDRRSFAHLWEKAFQLADAASCNTRPIIFDNVIMSMLVAQQSEIQRLKDKIKQLEVSVEILKRGEREEH